MNTEQPSDPPTSQADFSATDDKHLQISGYAACLFITSQAFLFPQLGMLASIIAGLAGVSPALLHFARQDRSKAIALGLMTCLLSPCFYLITNALITVLKGI